MTFCNSISLQSLQSQQFTSHRTILVVLHSPSLKHAIKSQRANPSQGGISYFLLLPRWFELINYLSLALVRSPFYSCCWPRQHRVWKCMAWKSTCVAIARLTTANTAHSALIKGQRKRQTNSCLKLSAAVRMMPRRNGSKENSYRLTSVMMMSKFLDPPPSRRPSGRSMVRCEILLDQHKKNEICQNAWDVFLATVHAVCSDTVQEHAGVDAAAIVVVLCKKRRGRSVAFVPNSSNWWKE